MENIIRKTAELARLDADNDIKLIEDMKEIIAFASVFKDEENTNADSSTPAKTEDMREDCVQKSFESDEIKLFAPDFSNGYLFVPKALED